MLHVKQSQRAIGFTLVELLVVIGIIAVLIALLLPAVQKVREAANSVRCKNNLKQLGLGTIAFHDSYGSFPQGYFNLLAGTNNVKPNWCVALLPFLEQQPLFQQLSDMARVDGPAPGGYGTIDPNWVTFAKSPGATPLPVFICPSDNGVGGIPVYISGAVGGANPPGYMSPCNYAGNSGIQANGTGNAGVVVLNGRVSVLDILDGTSNTFLYGERTYGGTANFTYWANKTFGTLGDPPIFWLLGGWVGGSGFVSRASGYFPLNYNFPPPSGPTPSLIQALFKFGYRSGHPDGANFVLCDGSVPFLGNSINAAAVLANGETILQALSSRAGGEAVSASDYY